MVSNPYRTSDIICELEFWRPLSDENSHSNWRNLSEDNETGVDLKHHWKNIINDIVLYIIVPKDYMYGSGKYRRLGRQTLKNFLLENGTDELIFL